MSSHVTLQSIYGVTDLEWNVHRGAHQLRGADRSPNLALPSDALGENAKMAAACLTYKADLFKHDLPDAGDNSPNVSLLSPT